MAIELIKALVAITVLLALWLAVQRAWQATFRGAAGEGDALAGRTDCHGCSADATCESACGARE